MYTLICDSATKTLYMALLKDREVLAEKYYRDGKMHSVNIVSGIEEMLKTNNVIPQNIDKFICGIGPGSYTGVRMAVTVAKMFGAFTQTKVYEISTLALMASDLEGKVLSYIDARNGNVFGAIYEDGKTIIADSFKPLIEFEKECYDKVVCNENYVVNPLKVIDLAKEVVNSDLLVPNYLRDTEAERNLNAKL